ncbi:MAG TPA: YihY/virulence factor BrkB family protein [Nitrospiria bacterium]|nr:YihY/virulence factor BrkB family protein [Nitrospiria bacterium]
MSIFLRFASIHTGHFKRAIVSFYKDGCATMAAALSYFSLLSLFPLLIVLVAILGKILGGSRAAYDRTLSLIQEVVPKFDQQLIEELNRLIRHASYGFLAMAVLLWMALQVFIYLEQSMIKIFKIPSRFGLLRSFWMSLLMLFGTGILIVASLFLTFAARGLRKIQMELGGVGFFYFSSFFPVLIYLIPILLTFSGVALIYRNLPQNRVRWAHALLGGGLVSLLTEGAKQLFAWYVEEISDIKGIYGSLTAVVLFLIWVYYSSALMFLGAEWVHQLQMAGKGKGNKTGKRKRRLINGRRSE